MNDKILPLWKTAPGQFNHLTALMSDRSSLRFPYLATYALETGGVAVEDWYDSEDRKCLRTEAEAIAEMVTLGGTLFYDGGHEVWFGWDNAIVRLGLEVGRKGVMYLNHGSFHGMRGELQEKISELSKGWFGRKIRHRKVVEETTMHMLSRSRGEYGLIPIGSEANTFIPGNYMPEVASAFDFLQKSLLADEPTGRLALLDGPPGTGKTRFVRALMGSLCNRGVVIVVPEHLTAELADPDLIPVFRNVSQNGEPIILVLEDADDCLKSREETEDRGSTKALASLLNLSDGIVGALLDLRVIATTNIRITRMDPAITRPGRLLTRVQFGALSVEKAGEVLSRLTEGKGNPPTEEMTLAEVYALSRPTETE